MDLKKVVKEIVEQKKLELYENEVSDILARVLESGCRLSTRYDNNSSSHKFPNSTEEACRIRISLLKNYENPLDVIWTILHEFGHHLSKSPKKEDIGSNEGQLQREKLAWDFAEKEISKYPKLINNLPLFVKFRDQCIASYAIKN